MPPNFQKQVYNRFFSERGTWRGRPKSLIVIGGPYMDRTCGPLMKIQKAHNYIN